MSMILGTFMDEKGDDLFLHVAFHKSVDPAGLGGVKATVECAYMHTCIYAF